LNNITSLETMVKCLDKNVSNVHYKSITLAETDDIIHNSAIIPIEYDFEMDMFGKTNNTFIMPQIDELSIAGLTEQNYETMLGDELLVQKPSVTSTGRKPNIERAPFGDITNITNEKMRNEQESIAPVNLETNLGFEETENVTTHIDLPFKDTILMPALYQTTMMEPQTILKPEQPEVSKVYENEEEMSEDPALRGMTKTFSADIRALKEQKYKKMQTVINRKRKHMTVDIKTTLPTANAFEREKRMKPLTRPGSQEYREYIQQRTREFTEAGLATQCDYHSLDLIREPMCLLSSRTEYPLNKRQKETMLYVKLVNKFGSLTSGAQYDDTHSYLTHARDVRAQIESSELPTEVSMAEKMRQADASVNAAAVSKTEPITKKKRDSTLIQQKNARNSTANEHLPVDSMQMEPLLPMMSIDEFLPPMQDLTTLQKPSIQINSETLNEQTKLSEADIYESLIIDSVFENDDIVLQELIKSSKIPEKCNGRKMLAARMFRACLDLAGKRAISVTQDKAYDSIKINLVEN